MSRILKWSLLHIQWRQRRRQRRRQQWWQQYHSYDDLQFSCHSPTQPESLKPRVPSAITIRTRLMAPTPVTTPTSKKPATLTTAPTSPATLTTLTTSTSKKPAKLTTASTSPTTLTTSTATTATTPPAANHRQKKYSYFFHTLKFSTFFVVVLRMTLDRLGISLLLLPPLPNHLLTSPVLIFPLLRCRCCRWCSWHQCLRTLLNGIRRKNTFDALRHF